MDGLHEMTAAAVAVEIGGCTYQLHPLRARDWGEAARMLLSKKRPALDVLKDSRLKDLPDEAVRHLVELAWHDERSGELVPAQEIDCWFRRGDGAAYEFWLMIRQAQPEISLERAEGAVRPGAPRTGRPQRARRSGRPQRRARPGKLAEPGPRRSGRARHRPIPWRRIFRRLSADYGWTPRQIGDMTLAQINVYYGGLADAGEELEVTAVRAREIAQRAGQEKTRFLRRWFYGADTG